MAIYGHDLAWHPDAAQPDHEPPALPIPGTRSYARMRGRSGDLLVVQVRGAEHLKQYQKESLYSLGLHGVDSFSLRRSDDPTTWGYVRKVAHIVGVIELPRVEYKSDYSKTDTNAISVKSEQFGSSTRPGGLFKDESGNYFSYQSHRSRYVLNWSSDCSVLEFYEVLAHHSKVLEAAAEPDASSLGIIRAGLSHEPMEPFDDDLDVLDLPTNEALSILASHRVSVAFAQLAFRGMSFTWHEPYRRFQNDDRVAAAVGAFSDTIGTLPVIKDVAARTGDSQFFREASAYLEVRGKSGNLQRIPFEPVR